MTARSGDRVLVVEYLPRGPRSRTRELLEAALEAIPEASVERLDLARMPPRALDATALNAYVQRNYAGLEITAEQSASLGEADALAAQLLAADALILAFPVFNFSVPAAVKAWLDAVMQKGRTWQAGPGGRRGLLKARSALVLMTSGGDLSGERAAWDHARPLVEHCLAFMGVLEVRCVRAERLNSEPAGAEARLAEAARDARHAAAALLASAPA